MTKREQILAVLSTSGRQPWTPVQVQKIFFLLDKKVSGAFGGPLWDFTPYDYGPFDAEVYRKIEWLSREGLTAVIRPNCGMRQFYLTPKGQEEGQRILSSITVIYDTTNVWGIAVSQEYA